MTKTFQEWFDTLDWSNQKYLAENSRGIIKSYDKNGKETNYYSDIVAYKLKYKCIPSHNKDNFFSTFDRASKSWKEDVAIQMLYASRLKAVDMISDSEYYAAIREAINKFSINELCNFITEDDFKPAMRQVALNGNMDRLIGCLLAADDIEHPDWSLLASNTQDKNGYFDYKWFRFIPFDEALKLIRKDISRIPDLLQHIRNDIQEQEVKNNCLKQIRELVFCEDGLAENDRDLAIINIYRDRSIHDFVQEILPIDIRYGRLIPALYKAKHYNDKAIIEEMNSIINMRKGERSTQEERSREGWYESIERNQYRYCKQVRQMAMIVRACLTKSYPKSKASLIGDALCLLKMYNFNYDQIFRAVYGHSDI